MIELTRDSWGSRAHRKRGTQFRRSSGVYSIMKYLHYSSKRTLKTAHNPQDPASVGHLSRAQLVNLVTEAMGGCSRGLTVEFLDFILDAISSHLVEGGEVQLIGFGTFGIATRPERTQAHPATGESTCIPSSRSVTFKMSDRLKRRMRERGET